ncbi:MAG: ABC transporter permease, partial [Firmicutes bacterium]|nr:ABC transporter permease [Bacillota bacterium]
MKKRRNYNLILGCALTCVMVALIVMGWLWTPFDPNAMDAACRLQSPSLTHLLGTDNFGRDIFSRVLQGAGATFLIGVAVVLIGGICGV